MMVELNQLSMSRMSNSHQADAGAQGKLQRPTVVDLFLEGAEAKMRTKVAPASAFQVQAMATAPRSGSVRSTAAVTPATDTTAKTATATAYISIHIIHIITDIYYYISNIYPRLFPDIKLYDISLEQPKKFFNYWELILNMISVIDRDAKNINFFRKISNFTNYFNFLEIF